MITVGETTGTRLWEYEVKEAFSSVQIGQRIHVKSGPFCGSSYVLVGTIQNRFDKFFFVDPATQLKPGGESKLKEPSDD